MRKHERFIFAIIAIICLISLFTVLEKFAIPMETNIVANAANYKNATSGMIVCELSSGRVLSENNADAVLEMASTTKILTAYLAICKQNLDTSITITKEMCGVEGSSIYLKEGEIWTLEQLLYGLMLRSGNDAATAVAIAVGGSVDNFVAQMNEFANKHHLNHTKFANPHGLHAENHYTTARELAQITMQAMKNPVFAKIASTEKISFVRTDGISVSFANKNKLLASFEGACGVKTGYTKDAGKCLVSAAKRKGMTLIGVVLNNQNMWESTKAMLTRAFDEYSLYKILGPEKPFPFTFQNRTLIAGTPKRIVYPLKKEEYNSLTYQVHWKEFTENRLDLKKEVGEVSVFVQNQLLFSEKIYTILHIDGISLGNNKERLYENQQVFSRKWNSQPQKCG